MSSISKDVSGKWRARYRDPNGRTRSRNFDRRDDAKRFLTSIDHAKLAGAYIDPAGGRTTFGDYAKTWRKGIVDLRPSTLARDDGYLERYIVPAFGEARLSDIDHAAVRAWVAALSARKLAPATVVKAGQIMGKIMATAVRDGLIPSSPCVGVRLPKIEREEMRFLSPAEVATLAEAMDPRFRALVWLGAYGGLRIGEMFGLRVDRIDPLRGRVDVVETCVEVGGVLHFGPPKTRAGRRSVPLPRVALAALEDHLRAAATEPGDLVFRAPEGGPVRLASWRRRFWAPAIAKAGLAPLRPHDLRHTAVSLWIAAGASPKEVASRAGHSSVVTVLDRYGHLLPGSEDRVNDALDALASASSAQAEAPIVAMSRGSRVSR
jgi:integrase